jgi:hypothetical protein
LRISAFDPERTIAPQKREPRKNAFEWTTGVTHFVKKTPRHVRSEMVLHVLAHNLKRVMAIMGNRHR